jgi:hypothetical protein
VKKALFQIMNEVKTFWQDPDEQGNYREYCQAVVYYLDNYGEMILKST